MMIDRIERETPLLEVRGLSIVFDTRRGPLTAIDDVSFDLAPGEVLGVVGESGAGKSLTGTAIIGLLERPGRIAGGEIRFEGRRIDNLPRDEMRRIRGSRIGAIFQDPLTSLNPLFTVGQQLVETIRTHLPLGRDEARRRAIELLAEVGIPAPEQRIDHYPHQFSGGMRQRVVIALALSANPKLIVADEPTTALDVSIQAQILALLKRLCREHGAAVILVTHDMGVIAETADRVAVMYSGRIAEIGPVAQVVQHPRHPYTRGLMGSIPVVGTKLERLTQIEGAMPRLSDIPSGCAFHPRCPKAMPACARRRPEPRMVEDGRVACLLYEGSRRMTQTAPLVSLQGLKKHFDISPPFLNRLLERKPVQHLKAVDGVDLDIPRGTTFSLVGESGCGKSTVARLVVGLYRPTAGRILFDGTNLTDEPAGEPPAIRRRMQMIFQDPYASLNPRWRVRDIIAEPLLSFGLARDRAEAAREVDRLLRLVNLNPKDGEKYPHEFSGGQRQRISIARAIASKPDFLVCDEPTSALDVSVQAQILNLMKDLQKELGLTYLFISHDLAVVWFMSDVIGVMYLGRLVETGPARRVFAAPQHPYTRLLLDTIPDVSMARRDRQPVAGEVPNPIDPPPGCPFHPRCAFANDRCRSEVPVLRHTPSGAQAACHAVEEGRLPVAPAPRAPTAPAAV